ncbi:unnamed protein product [Schistosoma haematobium]|nr:unnamed protein product [Schistosoma haematobium]
MTVKKQFKDVPVPRQIRSTVISTTKYKTLNCLCIKLVLQNIERLKICKFCLTVRSSRILKVLGIIEV